MSLFQTINGHLPSCLCCTWSLTSFLANSGNKMYTNRRSWTHTLLSSFSGVASNTFCGIYVYFATAANWQHRRQTLQPSKPSNYIPSNEHRLGRRDLQIKSLIDTWKHGGELYLRNSRFGEIHARYLRVLWLPVGWRAAEGGGQLALFYRHHRRKKTQNPWLWLVQPPVRHPRRSHRAQVYHCSHNFIHCHTRIDRLTDWFWLRITRRRKEHAVLGTIVIVPTIRYDKIRSTLFMSRWGKFVLKAASMKIAIATAR